MRQEISAEAGQLMLDGELLPGLFDGVEVEDALDIDEQQVPGASESSRQIQGFKPATIVFKLTLPTDESTCFEKLRVLAARFKATGPNAEPYLRRVVNEHTAAWGIDQVVFSSLRSSDDNKSDLLKVELRFEEWRPVVRRKEQGGSGSPAGLPDDLMELLGYGSSSSHPTDLARAELLKDTTPIPWG